MKNNYLLAALYVVLMGFYANPTEAQPEIRYPNHAYLYWDEPCADSLEYSTGNMGITGGHPVSTDCSINPFGNMEEKQTVYGVAFPIIRSHNPISYDLFPDKRITLDIMLYQFTPGDSVVQLVKSQTFVVEQNQQPDLFMLYRLGHYPAQPVLDSFRKFPMYEFYFDAPQDMLGYFYVGMHSSDTTFMIPMGIQFFGNQSPVCCHNGYFGIVDMDRDVIISLSNYNVRCEGSEINESDLDGLTAPLPDTVFTIESQFAFPITKPRGYLSATTPMEEAGSVRLLPNPAKRWVTVEADQAIKNVELTDMAGRVVLSVQSDGVAKSVKLDVGRLTNSCYMVRVKTERETSTLKLVIDN